ncbi:MAG: Ku protein [Nitrospiria bacterium]
MAIRPLWKGSINFGLVNIPVKLYAATEEKSPKLHYLHDKDHARVQYRRVCTLDQEEVAWEHLARGFEFSKDRYVVLEDHDFEAIPSTKTIDLMTFSQMEEIDPILFNRGYYVAPEQAAAKPYALLLEAMRRSHTVAIGKIAFREKEHLALLRPMGQALIMETMFYQDEVRAMDRIDEWGAMPSLAAREIEMAVQIVNNLTAPFDPSAYRDEHRERLMEVIRKKVEGEQIDAAPGRPTGQVIDLMEALQASIQQTQRSTRRPAQEAAPAKRRKKAA